ncbi:hypothetical protein HQQ94_19270 [Shewanella sp. VB17]|uniref:hypothetical protein n=1 Tax=Shewanella sp. VB17 TaxID=2739432 RepID=UPI001567681C|nr:hypothetical protein [Shewanella sp. VB17]NRD75325.1 hypothetical protein [Shewanella sp. VB17]
MKIKITAALILASIVSVNASAANKVYGSVSELITRSGDKDSPAKIYFRLKLINPESSTVEKCMTNGADIDWNIDGSNPIINIQYQMLKESYENKTYLAVSGQNDVCEGGDKYYDNVFEMNTWSAI